MPDELLLSEAHKVLAAAIRDLSGLVNEAHRRQEFATLAALASVADGLSVLVRRVGQAQTPIRATARLTASPGEQASPTPVEADGGHDGNAAAATVRSAPSKRAAARSGRGTPETGRYPVFQVDDDGQTLVKVGYSKSDRREYEHRSPRDVLDRLTSLVTKLGAGGRRFTTEQILPPGEDQLADLPSYQVYLCLALLVRTGLLVRHGRQGYTVPEGADLKQAVDQAWSNLPKH